MQANFWTQGIHPAPGRPQRFGVEIEMHAYDAVSLSPLGTSSHPFSFQNFFLEIALLEPNCRVTREPESGLVLSVQRTGGGNFTLEPGGQVEYSSAACDHFSDLIQDVLSGLRLLSKAGQNQVRFLAHGTNPLSLATHPLVYHKVRYQKMAQFFQWEEEKSPSARGRDMMRRSAASQVSLDVCFGECWEDGVRLILALVPLTRYLFANAAYWEGNRSVFPSERQEIWRHMDLSRSRIPLTLWQEPIAPAYAQWARQAQVLFIQQLPIQKQPHPGELSFEKWHKEGFCGIFPSTLDWQLHLSTLFPDARLKQFIEIRSIDAQPLEFALVPLIVFYLMLHHPFSRSKTWDFLHSLGWRQEQWSNEIGEEKAHWHLPLLHFAQELASERKEKWMQVLLCEYEQFYQTRAQCWDKLTATQFVTQFATDRPHELFARYLGRAYV